MWMWNLEREKERERACKIRSVQNIQSTCRSNQSQHIKIDQKHQKRWYYAVVTLLSSCAIMRPHANGKWPKRKERNIKIESKVPLKVQEKPTPMFPQEYQKYNNVNM